MGRRAAAVGAAVLLALRPRGLWRRRRDRASRGGGADRRRRGPDPVRDPGGRRPADPRHPARRRRALSPRGLRPRCRGAAEFYEDLLEDLAAEGNVVVAPAMPGSVDDSSFAALSVLPFQPGRVEQVIDAVTEGREAIPAVDPERVVVAGHSLGAHDRPGHGLQHVLCGPAGRRRRLDRRAAGRRSPAAWAHRQRAPPAGPRPSGRHRGLRRQRRGPPGTGHLGLPAHRRAGRPRWLPGRGRRRLSAPCGAHPGLPALHGRRPAPSRPGRPVHGRQCEPASG